MSSTRSCISSAAPRETVIPSVALDKAVGNTGEQKPRPKLSINPYINNHRWLLTQPNASHATLEEIRAQARNLFSAPVVHRTSYRNHYDQKILDEPTKPRPTSPTRRNNPHPEIVFLTCRLHHVSGYHNADTTIGREPYKVDGLASLEEKLYRDKLREKYQDRPHTAALLQYRRNDADMNAKDAFETSSDCDELKDYDDLAKESANNECGSVQTKPSLNRYQRMAGPLEQTQWSNALRQLPQTRFNPTRRTCSSKSMPLRYHRQVCGPTVDYRRTHMVYQPTRYRGDFLIHPDWPPTLAHHSVP